MPTGRRRAGYGAIEVIVVVVIVVMVALAIAMAMPRRREVARAEACRHNLSQIGKAIALYQQAAGTLPTVPGPGSVGGTSPLAAMLSELGLDDFRRLADPAKLPAPGEKAPVLERRVPGFICPSDPAATSAKFPAPVSYRATTGSDPGGTDGAFALGRVVTIAEVEAGDGLAYTAAFSERLVGTGRDVAAPGNYASVPGPIPETGCPEAPEDAWRGDAGKSWAEPGWRSTLYNHALTPDPAASCIADDGRTAAMGASSGHAGRVHVLRLDGSVQAYTTEVDPKIWRALAKIDDAVATAPVPVDPPAPGPPADGPGRP